MPSITELLRLKGATVAMQVNGVRVTIGSTGEVVQCQFATELEQVDPSLEMGGDPREVDYAHFLRPAPNLAVDETITEVNAPENVWRVTSGRITHPHKSTVCYKVVLKTALDE